MRKLTSWLLNAVFAPGVRAVEPERPCPGDAKVLVLMLTHLGDCVIHLPLLRSLVEERNSKRNVHVVVKAGLEDLAISCPLLTTHSLKCPWVGAGSWSHHWMDLIRLILRLRASRFDIALVTHPHFLTSLTARLSGAKYTMGYAEPLDSLLHCKMVPGSDWPATKRRDHLLRSLGLAMTRERRAWPYFDEGRVSQGAQMVMERLARISLQAEALGGGPQFVCIHPGAGGPAKVWPWDNFVHAIRGLPASLRLPVILLGGEKEMTQCALMELAIHKETPVLNMAGQLGIPELFGVLSLARVYIGNDSGPSHLAALSGAPTLAIFGPFSDADIWKPAGDNVTVLSLSEPDFRTQASIAQVTSALRNMLEKRDAGVTG